MTKIEMIEDRYGPEDLSVREIARMIRTPLATLLAEWRREDRASDRAHRRWLNQRCSCGKLNRNCGEMSHQITNITPWKTPLYSTYPKTKPGTMNHQWITDEPKSEEAP